MVAISRCVGSLALVAVGAQSARIAKKRNSTNAQDCYSMYDGQALLQMKQCTSEAAKGIFSRVEALGCTVLAGDFGEEMQDCSAEVVCGKQAAAELVKDQVASVLSADAGSYWRGISGTTVPLGEGLGAASLTSANEFYSDWRDLATLDARIESLVQASGGVATIEVAGKSLQGRDIKVVRLRGAGWSPGKTRVFVSYVVHAREWITAMAGALQVEQLIEHVKQNPNYLDETEVVLMPMNNPDGFVYSTVSSRMWRKNMAQNSGTSCIGVDLNRNYDANFGGSGSSSSPCSDTYHGPSAGSEPETQVLMQVMNEAPNTVYIDVHSYTQLIISAYAYTTADNPREADYRQVGALMQAAMREVDGITYREGAAAQVLYTASGTTMDYGDKQGALGICFEMRPGRWGGGGFAPPVSEILPGGQESYAGVMAAIDYAKGYEPPAPTPAPPPGTWTLSGSGCEMDGDCISSLNYPSNYGNNERCTVKMAGDIALSVEAFSTEGRYDVLTMGGSSYSGTSGPASGTYSGTIGWATDGSVTNSGWRICKA